VAATKILSQQLLGASGWVHALPFSHRGSEAMDTLGAKPKRATEQDRIVGARIQMLRKSKGLSQTALGSAVGVTFQQVQKYENGQNRVGAGRLSEIARLLEVPVSAFFEEGDGAVALEQTELFDILRTRGAIDLLRAFATIEDDQLRREVLAIVRSTSRLGREQRS
jgi:transcriptional regulator with XRE-family HTH domain